MRRIALDNNSIGSNGIAALAAWIILAAVLAVFCRTETMLRFCNDFFGTEFSDSTSSIQDNFVYRGFVQNDYRGTYQNSYRSSYQDSSRESADTKHPGFRSELDKIAPMLHLSGGTFRMGNDAAIERDQRPAHTVHISPFRLDKHHVTNRQFRMFAEQTHYITDAEQRGWSYVFDFKRKCWIRMAGANWKNPAGTLNDDTADKTALPANDELPAVHISWNDAQRFCQWAGKRLPTEAEWEYAARAGRKDVPYSWGGSISAESAANFWQGWFPDENTQQDGFLLLSPVSAFKENPFGLNDMGGNAWQWCSDRYAADYYVRSPLANPQGADENSSEGVAVPNVVIKKDNGRFTAEEFGGVKSEVLRVIRGGSFLSSENNDAGYRVSARGCQPESLSFQDVGFRCAEDL